MLPTQSCIQMKYHKQESQSDISTYQGLNVGIHVTMVGMQLNWLDRQAAKTGLIPRYGRGFFSQCSVMVSRHPCVQPHALPSVQTLKIQWSISEFGGLWKH